MEDVSGGAAQSAEAQKMLVGESGAGVTSQAGQGTQPVVSSEVQPQQLSTVTQSGEDNQVRIKKFILIFTPPPQKTHTGVLY
jgi:hypothetical protein